MNKSIIVKLAVFAIVIACAVCVFCSCEKSPDSTSVYTCEVIKNGVSVSYTLNIDEDSGTFSITCHSTPESVYSGTFEPQNGYLILSSKQNGIEYVKTIGNTFSFFTPDNSNVGNACEHEFLRDSEVAGHCSSQGYILYKCTKCGEQKKETTDYGSHVYEDISYVKGTCQKKGYKVKKCKYCADEQTIYDKEYGPHTLSEVGKQVGNCMEKVVIRYHCTVCKDYYEEKPTGELGNHFYGENGVCIICSFDKLGLCHKHVDENQNGVCEDCNAVISVVNSIKEKGYYLSDDRKTLFMGAYPMVKSVYKTDEIIERGTPDPTTGYIRYNNASYKLVTQNSSTKAFVVCPIKWTLVENDGEELYVCNYVLDRKTYLYSKNVLEVIYKNSDNAINKNRVEYYNSEKYSKENENNILANDYENSDLCGFANNDFLSTAFTKRETDKIVGRVNIPTADMEELLYSDGKIIIEDTDYSVFVTSAKDKHSIFTSTPGENGKSVVLINAFYDQAEVTYTSGFVPVIKLNFNN